MSKNTKKVTSNILSLFKENKNVNFNEQLNLPLAITQSQSNVQPYISLPGIFYDHQLQLTNISNFTSSSLENIKQFAEDIINTTAQEENRVFTIQPIEAVLQIKSFPKCEKLFILQTITGLIQLWDFSIGKYIQTVNKNVRASLVTYSQNFDLMAIYSIESIGNIYLWNLNNGDNFFVIKDASDTQINLIQLNQEGSCIAIVDETNNIKIFATDSGDQLLTIPSFEYKLKKIVFVEKSNQLLIAQGKIITTWNLSTNEKIKDQEIHEQNILFMELTDPQQFLFTVGEEKKIKKWSVPNYLELQTYELPEQITGLCVSSSGKKIACTTISGLVVVYEENSPELKSLDFRKYQIQEICILETCQEIIVTLGGHINQYILYNYEEENYKLVIYWHTKNISQVIYSSLQKQLISCDELGFIIIWDLQNGKEFIYNHYISQQKEQIIALSLNQSETQLAVGTAKSICIWDTKLWNVIKVINLEKQLQNINFSNDSKNLYVCCFMIDLLIYDTSQYQLQQELSLNIKDITDVCFHPLKNLIALAVQKDLFIQEISTKKIINLITLDKGKIINVKFSKIGEFLAASSSDGQVRVWNYTKKYLKFVFQAQVGLISSFIFIMNDSYIVIGDTEANINIWCLTAGNCIQTINSQQGAIIGLMEISQNILASCGKSGVINVWQIGQYKQLKQIDQHDQEISSLAFSSNGNLLYVASSDGVLKIWRTDLWKQIQPKQKIVIDSRVTSFITFFKQQLLGIGELNGKLQILKTETDEVLYTFQESQTIRKLILSQNESYLAYILGDYEIIIRDITNLPEEKVVKLPGHIKGSEDICFYNVKQQLISCGSDNLIIFWDYSNPSNIQQTQILGGHKDIVKSINLNSKEDQLISCSYDGQIIIWEIQTYERIRTIVEPGFKYSQIQFINQDQDILAATIYQGYYIYQVSTGNTRALNNEIGDAIHSLLVSQKHDAIILGLQNGEVMYMPIRKQLMPLPTFNFICQFFQNTTNSQYDVQIRKFISKAVFENINSVSIIYSNLNILHLLAYAERFKELDSILKNLLNFFKTGNDQEASRLVTYLFCQDSYGRTPFDIAILKKNQLSLESIINLFYQSAPLNGAIYSQLVNQNFGNVLASLLSIGVRNIHLFLDSRVFNLENSELPEMAEQKFEIISLSLNDDCFDLYKEKNDYQLIENQLNPYTRQNKRDTSEARRIKISKVDIPHILTFQNKTLELISILPLENPIYNSGVIQAIMHFKWSKYARKEFLQSFAGYIVISILFTVNSVYILPNKTARLKYQLPVSELTPEEASISQEEQPSEIFIWISLAINIILAIFNFKQGLIEFFQLKKKGIKNYFNQVWNYIDIITILLTLFQSFQEIVLCFTQPDPQSESLDIVKLISSINLLILWAKLLSFLRGFESFAFLMTMIPQGISDMKSFILIVLYTIIIYGLSGFVIQDDYAVDQLDMIKNFYSLVLGEWDDYIGINTSAPNYLWLLFLTGSFFTSIVLLNLLISILGNTFNTVSALFNLASNYERIQLILDIDRYKEKDKETQKIMKKFLITITFPNQSIESTQLQKFEKKASITLKNIQSNIENKIKIISMYLQPLEEMSSKNLQIQELKSEEEEILMAQLFSDKFSKVDQAIKYFSQQMNEFRKTNLPQFDQNEQFYEIQQETEIITSKP